MAKTLAW